MDHIVIGTILFVGALAVITGVLSLSGDGGLKRMTTLSGIYAVCEPSGYPVVCFAEKGGTGMVCLPLSEAGGKCL